MVLLNADSRKSPRGEFAKYMKEVGITCSPHYVPLHHRPIFHEWGRFIGEDVYTTAESDRLIRLPLYYNLSDGEQDTVVNHVYNFFKVGEENDLFDHGSGMEGMQDRHETNGYTNSGNGTTARQ